MLRLRCLPFAVERGSTAPEGGSGRKRQTKGNRPPLRLSGAARLRPPGISTLCGGVSEGRRPLTERPVRQPRRSLPASSQRTSERRRYRYHISRPLIPGPRRTAPTGLRVPAPEIEQLVAGQVRKFIAESGGLVDATAAAAHQQALLDRAAEVSARWAMLSPSEIRTLLQTGRAYARARELWEQLGSPSEFLDVPLGQSFYHTYRGEFDLALRLDEDLLRLSRQRNDSGGLVLGHFSSGRTLMLTGGFALSRSNLEAGLPLYDPISHSSLVRQAGIYPHVNSLAFLGNVLFCLGFPDQALARSNAAIDEARRLAHPPSLALSLALGAILLSLVGENAALDQLARQLVAVANEQGFPYWRAEATMYSGWVMVKNGDVAEGMSLLRSGSDAFRATGAEARMPYHMALLARACEIAWQVDEAATLLDEALQIAERTGERWFAAELIRHQGQLLLRQGHPEAAEDLYCKALSIAAEQGAKLWELRAAVSLARLCRDEDRRTEARDLLAPVYGWFTEGFDTVDLKEAKALLNELT